MMDLNVIMNSKEYKDAADRVAKWKERIEKGGPDEAIKVRDEKMKFFSEMRDKRPDLYAVFELDDKTLSEMFHKKVTGEDIIID